MSNQATGKLFYGLRLLRGEESRQEFELIDLVKESIEVKRAQLAEAIGAPDDEEEDDFDILEAIREALPEGLTLETSGHHSDEEHFIAVQDTVVETDGWGPAKELGADYGFNWVQAEALFDEFLRAHDVDPTAPGCQRAWYVGYTYG